MPARVLALREELCNAALASPTKMAAAFDRVREQMFSSAPLPVSGSATSATGERQRAKHIFDTLEATRCLEDETQLMHHALSSKNGVVYALLGSSSPSKRAKTGPGVNSASCAISADPSSLAESTKKMMSSWPNPAFLHGCADQITDSDQESASTCDSGATSESDFEGDACQRLRQEYPNSLTKETEEVGGGSLAGHATHQVVMAPPAAPAALARGGYCCRQQASGRQRARAGAPTLRTASSWGRVLRNIVAMFVCVAALELGARGCRRRSILSTMASAAGIPLAAGSLFQHDAPEQRVLFPQQALAVQLPEDNSAPILPQAMANEIRMKVVKGGAADEYRVLLDVSSIQAMLVRRGQARLCLTVHKQQVGPAPPAGSRGGAHTQHRHPPPAARRHPMAHLPFAQNCADSSSTAALLDWQGGYSASLGDRLLGFSEAFTVLRGGDLWQEFIGGEQSHMGMSVVQLHFLLTGLRPGSYRISALIPTSRGGKLTAQTLLRVSRTQMAPAPTDTSYTDELGVVQVMPAQRFGFAGENSPARGIGSPLAVAAVYDSGVFDTQ